MHLLARLGPCLALSLICTGLAGVPLQTRRLLAPIQDNRTFLLTQSTPPVVTRRIARDEGPAAASQQMPRLSLHFTLTAAQQADLNQLLKDQQDQLSPQFHKFLTPEEYAARFGMNNADLALVSRWLEESGFFDIQVARSQSFVSFSGSVAKTEAAFHTAIHRFSLRGEAQLANTGDPELPAALQGIVENIQGLHAFRWHSHLRTHFTAGSGVHYLAPDDWATIYDVRPLYMAGYDGSGVSIAVVGQSDIQLSDIAAFRSAAGLPARAPSILMPNGNPGFQNSSGDEDESDLDVEWAGAIAKNASIVFITSPSVRDSVTYAIDNSVAPILATSYGTCEADETQSDVNSQNSLYQQAGVSGITILAAAGDDGATDCDSSNEPAAVNGLYVDFPASSPYVTGVGGTTLSEGAGNYWSAANNGSNGSAQSYIPEMVWNDGFQDATGGGFSIFGTKPSWQAGPGVPADGARDVPDLAFAGSPNHDAYLICGHNFCTNGFQGASSNLDTVGGTSVGPPTFASVLALLIQKQGSTSLGLINPTLYSVAQISPNVFHDITQGNNKMPCQTNTPDCPAGASPIGYSAAAGYDQASGLGSPDVNNLATQYLETFSISANPAAVTVQPGTSSPVTVTVSPANNFNGNVSFACSVASSLSGVTCAVPATTVNTSGTTAVTITAANNAHTVPFTLRPRWPGMLLFSLVLGLAFLVFVPKQRSLYAGSLYAVSASCLLAVAVSAVSCGGGGASVSMVPTTPVPATLSLTCTLAGSGMPGMIYAGNCSGMGGTAPLTYFIDAGALPAGLSLNASTGAITGTPTAAGVSSFTVKVSDSGSPQQTTTQTETIVIGPVALSLSCMLPSSVMVNSAYSGSCSGTGGVTPLSYSLSAGTLPPGLSLNTATGAISGLATFAGRATFTVQVSDSGSPAQTAMQTQTISILPATLTLSCSTPASDTAGVPYSSSCTSSGGTAPLTFSLASGALPVGLTLNSSNGAITGVPTLPGASSFAIEAADSSSPQQTATTPTLMIVVSAAPLSLTCSLPSSSATGHAYSGACTATGGTGSLHYSIGSGSLPVGLSLNSSTGVVTGTPTTPGVSSFTLSVSDSGSPQQSATQPATITVSASTLVLTCTLPGNAAVRAAYSGTCAGSGGAAPLSYAISTGSLPAGLTLNSTTGAINGVPTAASTSAFTVRVTDSGSRAATQNFQITVANTAAFAFNPTLPAASQGSAFSYQFAATGGNAPYTYAVTAGALPAGLALNASTGTLSGTPSAGGTNSFSVTASDGSSPAQTASKALTLAVSESAAVTITATSGGLVRTAIVTVTVP